MHQIVTHSGAPGDVFHRIPTVQSVTDAATLLLQPDFHAPIPTWAGGRQDVLITHRQAEFLAPLLRQQPIFEDVQVYNHGEKVDIDLDQFPLLDGTSPSTRRSRPAPHY